MPAGDGMMRATVKWFNSAKGFGFVTPADGSAEAFLHLSALKQAGYESIGEGASVTVEVGSGAKGRQVLRVLEVHGAAARSIAPGAAHGDRLARIAAIVGVLERVSPEPVGATRDDMLDQSLRVFGIVHAERPFDEELLTAALVHDVGMAIDRADPVARGIEALGDLITPRTRWLVETLPAARAYDERTLGQRARQRLESHPDFLDILLLAEAGRHARAGGPDGPSLEAAIAVLRELDERDAACNMQ